MPEETPTPVVTAVPGDRVQSGLFRPPPPRFEDGTVADAMRRGLVSCPPDTPLRAVAEMMASHRIHCVVVRDDGVPVHDGWSIVTDLDLVSASLEADPVLGAGELRGSRVPIIGPDARLGDAAALMASENVTHLLVVDPATHRPVGVISALDLAGALARRTR